MKLLDKEIIILKSIDPITVLENPNKKTVEFLAQIIQDTEFKKYLEVLRGLNNFPKEGIPIKEFIGKNFYELPAISNSLVLLAFENTAFDLCKSIGLSEEFVIPMLLLIFFNAFIDIDYFEGFITNPIEFYIGRRNIADAMWKYSHEVGAIVLPYNLSQRSLLKWIKNNWENIQNEMDKNLTANPYALRLHKNTEIAVEIVELKDVQGKSYNEIAQYLSDKYPEDTHVIDAEWVKKIYHDYKDMWQAVSLLAKVTSY